MELDSRTLLVAVAVALFFFGGALAYFWLRDRRASWFALWAVAMVVAAASSFWFAGNWQGDALGTALGGAVRAAAAGLLWQGARLFEGRQPLWLAVLVAPIAWLVACSLPGFLDNLMLRVAAVSVVHGTMCGLASWEFWRGRAENLPSRLPMMVVLGTFAAFMAGRLLTVGLFPFPVDEAPGAQWWLVSHLVIVFTHLGFAAVLLVSLTKERLELRQREITLVDPLTGLMNRRAFMGESARRLGANGPDVGPSALLLLDLDHFKQVNDRHGHDVGDTILTRFADIASASIRPSDRVFRLGGEEFAILLPGASLQVALQVAERVRAAFESHGYLSDDVPVEATVSIGIAVAEQSIDDLEVMLGAADAALYEAKSRGRNRIVVADPASLADTARLRMRERPGGFRHAG